MSHVVTIFAMGIKTTSTAQISVGHTLNYSQKTEYYFKAIKSIPKIWLHRHFNKGNSGRRRTARTEQNIAAVRTLLEQNRRDVSARRNPVEISSSGFNRITRLDLR